MAGFWRQTYTAVIPGWHQNKEHWNTVILDGSIPDKDVRRMIAESYDLVTASPTKRIYEAVQKIPKGNGWQPTDRLRNLAGDKKMARGGRKMTLHKNPDPGKNSVIKPL